MVVIAAAVIFAIVGIVIGFQRGQQHFADNRIRNDVGQLRWQAEIAYDNSGASYRGWTQAAGVNHEQISLLLEDIDKTLGDPPGEPYTATIRDTQRREYCISAPKRSDAQRNYCADATGIFKVVSQPCPSETNRAIPLRCPSV